MSIQHFEWSGKYALGIEEIDLQHHYFLNLINRLFADLANTEDSIYRKGIFKELSLYAHFHFSSEENMMLRAAYPQLPEHKRHHDELIDRLNLNKLNFERDKAEAEQLVRFLEQWFLHHTLKEDRKFANFLNQE